MLLLAASIGAAMAGALYVGVQAERAAGQTEREASNPVVLSPVQSEEMPPEVGPIEEPMEEEPMEEEPMLQGASMPDLEEIERLDQLEWIEELDRLASIAESDSEDIVLDSGVRIGPIELVDPVAPELESTPTRPRTRRPPRPPPGPRLHSDPGQHTVLVARQMIARDERIQGSCYAYLSEVYARAGHQGWRKRTIVYRAGREGPYADLDLIRPGDWLYIVNDPGRTPVGTHSVMFVGWQDRARGYARTISHAGWGEPRSGRERGYDVSQTYRIIRPTM